MSRWTTIVATAIFAVVMGCSGNGVNPTSPGSDLTSPGKNTSNAHGTTLWGLYDLHFDLNAGTVEAVINRSAMFTANVTSFINPNPAGLQFADVVVDGTAPVNVTLDVGVSHPLNDAAYDGYDVLGMFIGDGSRSLAHNGALISDAGVDQSLNNADGYSRWFNPTEFAVPGVLGYTAGTYATGGYEGSATLNPYKLFADGLDADDDAADFVITEGGPGNNVFLHGTTNTRHYDLDFPTPTPNVVFNYAIIASWEAEDVHPANSTEALVATVTQTESLAYDETNGSSGNLILDFTLAGYGAQPSTIYIESSVLDAVASFDAATIATGGGATYSTYSIDVPADTFVGNDGQDAIIIAEYSASTYGNEFGVPNGAEDDPLSSYFRTALFVGEVPPPPPLFSEEFDTALPADWAVPAPYQYFGACTVSPISWMNTGEYGPSGVGSMRIPNTVGGFYDGGDLETLVSKPFDVPTGYSEVTMRAYLSFDFGGSWIGYFNANFKIAPSSTPGVAPFIHGATASIPAGGAILYPTMAHGANMPAYLAMCSSGPLSFQDGWNGSVMTGSGVGTAGPITSFVDLVIPPAYYGQTVKVALQFHPDWCDFVGGGGELVTDDWGLLVY